MASPPNQCSADGEVRKASGKSSFGLSTKGRTGARTASAVRTTSQATASQKKGPKRRLPLTGEAAMTGAAALAPRSSTSSTSSTAMASAGVTTPSSATASRSSSSAPGTMSIGSAVLREGSGMADPGVEEAVQEVDQEVHDDEGDADHDDGALHHEEVALEDAEDDEAAEAVESVDLLDDQRPADEVADGDADHGQERERRRAEGVAEEDVPRRHALRLGHADEVLLEGGHHVRAQQPHVDGHQAEGQGQRRQQHAAEVLTRVLAELRRVGGRQPVELEREEVDEQHPEDEVGQ